jgi:membrane associated rhomboid family serine protease
MGWFALICSVYYRNALTFSQGTLLDLSPRLRWKLDRFREQINGLFGGGAKEQRRPQLCPACGTLVGSTATKCHQCGASLTFGMAAATRSLSRLMPMESPVTYGILTLSCLLYGASLIATIRTSGFEVPAGGGFSALMGFGAINGSVLQKLGASLPWPYDFMYPWRFIMPTFLHASLVHLGFNMFVLMDIGPQVEETYGSARYFFIYVVTGIGAYLLSGFFGNFSVGGSGALLGLIGVMLAVVWGERSAQMQMLRSNLIRWLIYIAVLGFFFRGTDNAAHLGGFIGGFVLGKIMTARTPASPQEKTRADLLGWTAAILVVASLVVVAFVVLRAA